MRYAGAGMFGSVSVWTILIDFRSYTHNLKIMIAKGFYAEFVGISLIAI